MKIRIATCLEIPEPDHDEVMLLEALRRRGMVPELVAWDDATVDWTLPLPCLIRSTWNYHLHRERFLSWADHVARHALLLNPVEILRWNTDKHYLADLCRAGIPVVDTVYVHREEAPVFVSPWQSFVLKPSVGAGSHETYIYHDKNDSTFANNLGKITSRCTAMVQPYMAGTVAYGERSLIVIEGTVTHSIRKSPRFAGNDESVTGPHPIEAPERALAEQVLAWLGKPLLYARIDCVRDDHGHPRVMELELVEPSLFFREHPSACEQLVSALCQRLGMDEL
jgi:glutathione synthase/RimK-type ligase-like ATP-grasp enzyme